MPEDIKRVFEGEVEKSGRAVEDGSQPLEDLVKKLEAEEASADRKGGKAKEISFEMLQKLEEIKGEIRDTVEANAAVSAESMAEMLKSLDASAAMGPTLLESVTLGAIGEMRKRLPKLKLEEAKGEMRELARQTLIAALEERMAGEKDEEMVGKLDKVIESIRKSGATEQAA